MPKYFLQQGNCLDSLKQLGDNSVDSIVTDPPYGLSNHKPEEVEKCLKAWINDEVYCSKGTGFMGKEWDKWVPGPEVWKECYRVLKPGGHMLVFAGTRSMDLMSMAIRLSRFELRDIIMWTYGSGFPKSLDVSKAIDKAAPATPAAREWSGWGTALKPAYEPIIIARKPLDGTVAENVLKYSTGGINIDGCRVGIEEWDSKAMERVNTPGSGRMKGRDPIQGSRGLKGSDEAAKFLDTTAGRWPANLIHDGSPEVLAGFPEVTSGRAAIGGHKRKESPSPWIWYKLGYQSTVNYADRSEDAGHLFGDSGSAARFFYCAKASKTDRNEGLEVNTHPTVKPTSLMRWLVRLVTPPDGIVLDPFMGSGSTGKAAMLEQFNFIGMELDEKYMEIAEARIIYARENREELLEDDEKKTKKKAKKNA